MIHHPAAYRAKTRLLLGWLSPDDEDNGSDGDDGSSRSSSPDVVRVGEDQPADGTFRIVVVKHETQIGIYITFSILPRCKSQKHSPLQFLSISSHSWQDPYLSGMLNLSRDYISTCPNVEMKSFQLRTKHSHTGRTPSLRFTMSLGHAHICRVTNQVQCNDRPISGFLRLSRLWDNRTALPSASR